MKKVIVLGLVTLLLNQCSFSQKKMDNTKNPVYSHTETKKVDMSEEDWKKTLSPEVYQVARQKGTEWAFSGKYWNHFEAGTYYCAACGNPLFKSDAKFESSCGWPSFFEPISEKSMKYKDDRTHGMTRTEVLCGRCDAHLGHIFDDGPPPTYKRYCINSVVLNFEGKK